MNEINLSFISGACMLKKYHLKKQTSSETKDVWVFFYDESLKSKSIQFEAKMLLQYKKQ